jgi:hypothetical protein
LVAGLRLWVITRRRGRRCIIARCGIITGLGLWVIFHNLTIINPLLWIMAVMFAMMLPTFLILMPVSIAARCTGHR